MVSKEFAKNIDRVCELLIPIKKENAIYSIAMQIISYSWGNNIKEEDFLEEIIACIKEMEQIDE